MKRIAQMLLGAMLVFQGVAWAESNSRESTGAKVGYGAGSVVGSAVYLPFKASFYILGGIGSGFALLFAGPNTADRMVSTTCRGTWAITPSVVKGNESVHFVGDAPAPASQARP